MSVFLLFFRVAFTKGEHVSKNKSSLKSKRVRTIFTPEQLERLEAEFERQQYMVGPERLYLAHTLQLTEAQVGNIFIIRYQFIHTDLLTSIHRNTH